MYGRLIAVSLSVLCLWAQTVEIENAEELGGTPERRVLRGNVRLRQDTILLLCAEAEVTEQGSFSARGGVITYIGNSGQIKAALLTYDPESRRLTYDGGVQADFPPARLKARRLHYDRTTEVVWYEGGGTFSDTTGEIRSDRGQYDTRTDVATFSGKVQLYRTTTQARTDSLIYESWRYYAIFPQRIVAWDTVRRDTLIAEKAEWNRQTGEIFLRQKAHYRDTTRLIWAEEAYYHAELDSGQALCSVHFRDRKRETFAWADTAYWIGDSLRLHGNAALLFIQPPESTFLQSHILHTAPNRAYAIQNAELLHPPYLARSETLWYDTLLRVAYLHGKAWVTDSLMQLYAERISIFLKEKRPDSAYAAGEVKFLNQADSFLGFYHQATSDSAVAFWDSTGRLQKVHFVGRVQVLYYQSADRQWKGVHHAYAQQLYAELDSLQQPAYVRLEGKPHGTFYPIAPLIEAPLWIVGVKWLPPERQPTWPFSQRRSQPYLKDTKP